MLSQTLSNYTGRELDSETELYYYRARYYDDNTGRFPSEDPIRFKAGTNFYAYVLNNPVNDIDPTGFEKVCLTKLMLVTAYCVHGTTASGAPAGPGTVAVANTKPKPYAFGCSVTVTNSATGNVDYAGTVKDTGAGWNASHHDVLPDAWIDIWLSPCQRAREWGVKYRQVTICCDKCT